MTNLENLKKLAENVGADASKCSTNLGALNVISAALGGSGDAQTNAEAIEDIAQAAPAAMEQNVVWADGVNSESFNAQPNSNNTMVQNLRKIVVPDGVKTISNSCFGGCVSLEEVVLPNSVKELANGAFMGTSVLKKVILNDGLVTIGASAFGQCEYITEIDIPASVTSIGAQFLAGTAVKSLTIKSGTVTFDAGCLNGASNLEKVYIMGSNVTLYEGSFSNTSITDIYVPWSEGEVENAPWMATNAKIHYNWLG